MSGQKDRKDMQKVFMERLRGIVQGSAGNGNVISPDELEECFADLSLTPEQMMQVRAYLVQNGIGVGEPLPLEERITREEHDYFKDYMQMLEAIEIPPANILDAVNISSMAGERDAQEKLITFSLRNVAEIARLYAGQGVLMEDLIGAGNEALTVGATLLAPLEKLSEVDGFLASRIMDAMENLISCNVAEKAADKGLEDRVNLIAEKAAELASDLGRPVSAAELAAEGELEEDEILEIMRISGNAIRDIAPQQ